MKLNPNLKPLDFILFFLFILIIGVFFFLLYKRDKIRKGGEDWFEYILKTLNLSQYKNCIILNNSNNNLTAENLLIYTSGEFIYIINKINQSMKKIYKSDILNIDLSVYETRKNVKQLIALTSTYNSKVNITGLELKIITKTETHSILMMSGGKNVDNITIFDKSKLIDDANRCRLLIESDIKKINTENY